MLCRNSIALPIGFNMSFISINLRNVHVYTIPTCYETERTLIATRLIKYVNNIGLAFAFLTPACNFCDRVLFIFFVLSYFQYFLSCISCNYIQFRLISFKPGKSIPFCCGLVKFVGPFTQPPPPPSTTLRRVS